MLRVILALLLCGALCWGWPALLPAASSGAGYRVGLRTVGVNQANGGIRLDLNIWYPSIRAPRAVDLGPWVLHAARNGKPVEGRFPLLLLSHASPATRFSYHDTAAWLASCGFVVAAPTHRRDCLEDMSQRFTWHQLLSRCVELSAAIDLLLADATLAASIDAERIGLLGFGAGGTSGLLLGGALPSCADWPAWCRQSGSQDEYCNDWGYERIAAMCRAFPLRHSLADPRIKAVAAVSPGFGMLFGPDSFKHFHPPLLLVSAERDSANPPHLHSMVMARFLGNKARHLILPGADQGSLMAACPETLEAELPELCLSVDQSTRRDIHKRLQSALADFFLYWLGSGSNLPSIPPPPRPDISVRLDKPRTNH